VIDAAAAVVNHYTYEPYGQTLDAAETVTNPWRFTGQYWDAETEEYHLRARQYNPFLARFTARDPSPGDFFEPRTLHRYLYCISDPLNRVDLTGSYWDGPWWAQYEFWAEIGSEIVKGGAATLDGFNPIPFWHPLEEVYANPDGSVDRVYRGSRLLGGLSRAAAMQALNAYAVEKESRQPRDRPAPLLPNGS